MAKRRNKKPVRDDHDKPDPFRKVGRNNDLEVIGVIGDGIAFVSNGRDIRLRLSASPFQFKNLFRQVITEVAVAKGKLHHYQELLRRLDTMLTNVKFRVQAHVWLGCRDLKVDLPVDSGEIVPASWADPRLKADLSTEDQ